MEYFKPRLTLLYHDSELLFFVRNGQTSLSELQDCGLSTERLQILRCIIDKEQREEKDIWNEVLSSNSPEAYKFYIKKYEELDQVRDICRPEPFNWTYLISLHIWWAKRKMREHFELEELLTSELLYDIEVNPMKYDQHLLKLVVHGVTTGYERDIYLNNLRTDCRYDVPYRFLRVGLKLSPYRLKSVLPEGITYSDVRVPKY